MRHILALIIALQPYFAFAGSDLRYAADINSWRLGKIIDAGIYAPGGSREGLFFADLKASAPSLKQKEIGDYYGEKFPYEINDYYMSVAIENAMAEGNEQIVAELKSLRDEYRKPVQGGGWAIHPSVFKSQFIAILNKQFDQRMDRVAADFENRLSAHGGDYAGMLREYQKGLEHLEGQRFKNGLKKFVFFAALGGAGFVTVFMGIPLIIPFISPWPTSR